MLAPRWLIGAVVGTVGVAALVATRALRTNSCAAQRPERRPDPGWATCSAPGARTYEATFGRALTGLYRVIAIDLRDSRASQTRLGNHRTSLGLTAALLVLVGFTAPLSTLQVALNLPFFVNEMVLLAVWLIVKGFAALPVAGDQAGTSDPLRALQMTSTTKR